MKRDYVIIYDKGKQKFIFGAVTKELHLEARFYNGKRNVVDNYLVLLRGKYLKSRPDLDRGFRTIDKVIKYASKLSDIEILEEKLAYCIEKLKESKLENE